MKIEVERVAPRTKVELVAAVTKDWQVVTDAHASNLIMGIPRRLQKCLRLNGARIIICFFILILNTFWSYL